MAEFTELVQALTWLLTNRIQQKIDYIHGLLGDGNGRVRVSTIPGSPEVDFVFVRPDRFANRSFKVFNKRIEGQDGDPIIIGELPWEPGLIQVVDMDWAAYADVGWGDDVTTTNRHGNSHQWRDGAPGIDTFNVYRRQFGDLKTYPSVSGTLNVGVSPYSLDLFGKQYQWPGIQDFSLGGALPTTTGTARMALVYWSLASGTTQGHLGVATGTLGGDSEATILNRPVSPQGVIPSAFVRLAGGQSSITEFDIWDAREPFRPGILFGTGTAGLSADMIPISDISGLYTGSTIEAALDEIGFDGARVSKVYQSDFGEVAVQADAVGGVAVQGTGTFSIPENLAHVGDPDTLMAFTDDQWDLTVGGINMIRADEAGQDVLSLGDVGGGGNVNINFNAGQMLLQGSNGFVGINQVPLSILHLLSTVTDLRLEVDATTGVPQVAFYDPSGLGALFQWRGTTSTPSNLFKFGTFKTGGEVVLTADSFDEALRISASLQFGFNVDAPTKLMTARAQGNTEWLTAFRSGSDTEQFGVITAEGTGYTTDRGTDSGTWANIIESHNSNLMLTTNASGGTGGDIILDADFTIVGAGTIEGAEITAPGVGAANTYRIYGEDNGAGKTRVMIQFATGAPVQIAIQP